MGWRATASGTDTATNAELIAQAKNATTRDYLQFTRILKQLNARSDELSSEQQWQLRYLEAWKTSYEGHLGQAAPIIKDIIEHARDPALKTLATSLQINLLSREHRYTKAYTLADKLMRSLSDVKDEYARERAMHEIIQMLDLAGQTDLALKYARSRKDKLRPGDDRCEALSDELNVLFGAWKLKATSPELEQTIDICLQSNQAIYANVLRLDLATLLNYEGQPNTAIALLHRIAPSVRKSGFQPHLASLQVVLAQAYLKKGDDEQARKWALDALATSKNSGYSWALQSANKTLYQVEKNQGNDAEALHYHEKYVKSSLGALDDTKARALAYQMVRQEVLLKKLHVERLSKQNRILQLRQALDHKRAETNRLYILLLLIVLASIALWAYRTKHSQLRFRRMAREDDLTGTFNRQHFLDCASRLLQRMQKTDNEACLMILDMDHFKRVNDMYGHITGDVVLKHVTNICRHELRTSDVFGRLGGEEFGILMPGCTPQQGKEVGDRMRRALVNAPIQVLENESLTITASIGLASTRTSGYQLKRLLVHADEALYEAKRNGRNQLMISSGAASPETAAQPG